LLWTLFYQKCCENKAEKSPMRLEKSSHMGEDSADCGARLTEKSLEVEKHVSRAALASANQTGDVHHLVANHRRNRPVLAVRTAGARRLSHP
ncbi:MAG: hypothetical protein IIX61_04180, partial [Loktanella sp.]|nr:hypothetical protein [Loktanella sp.]